MNTMQKFYLLLITGLILTGCSDSDEKTIEYKTPEYEFPEGVYVSTPETLFEKSTYKDFAFYLAFYSSDSVFPIYDLQNSTVLIQPVSEPRFYLQSVHDHYRASAICLYHESFSPWKNNTLYSALPNHEEIDHVMELYYYFPGEGQYDFHLKFIMFDGSIYTTPVYRLVIRENLENKEFYHTNITILNNI